MTRQNREAAPSADGSGSQPSEIGAGSNNLESKYISPSAVGKPCSENKPGDAVGEGQSEGAEDNTSPANIRLLDNRDPGAVRNLS